MSEGGNRPKLIVPQLTVDDLRGYLARTRPELIADRGRRHFVLFMYILRKLVGSYWAEKNITGSAQGSEKLPGPRGYLELDFSADEIRETKTLRLYDLAEIIFNLQTVEGFDECMRRLRTASGGQVEATYAELQVAKLLYVHDMDFRFVVPSGKKGDDYDFEIKFSGGWVACADAKCKIETTTVDPNSVRSSLEQARQQLPPDRPGIIFVKVPQHWFQNRETMVQSLRDIATDFLRGTGRVVSIKFYVEIAHIDSATQMVLHRHAVDELNNPNARFERKYWDIFKGYRPPDDGSGPHPK